MGEAQLGVDDPLHGGEGGRKADAPVAGNVSGEEGRIIAQT